MWRIFSTKVHKGGATLFAVMLLILFYQQYKRSLDESLTGLIEKLYSFFSTTYFKGIH